MASNFRGLPVATSGDRRSALTLFVAATALPFAAVVGVLTSRSAFAQDQHRIRDRPGTSGARPGGVGGGGGASGGR